MKLLTICVDRLIQEAEDQRTMASDESRLAFKAGMESQQDGTPKEKNPYNHGERAYAWLRGWKTSYFKKYGRRDVNKTNFPSNHPSSDAVPFPAN